MFQTLPRLSQDSQELINATAAFAFHGESTDLLHPKVEREQLFPDETIMPAVELTPLERNAAVAVAISYSLAMLALDGRGGYFRGYPSQVEKPHAYLQLLKTGAKVSKIKDRYGPIASIADESTEVNPHLVSGVVYSKFTSIFGPDMTKPVTMILKKAEPKLRPDETEEQRQSERQFNREVRANHWRYGRTLGLAAFSGLMIFNAHNSSQIAKAENPPKIAELQAERQDTNPERQEAIDKEILHLNALMEGTEGLWFIVGGVALARFGLHYMTRPRREEK